MQCWLFLMEMNHVSDVFSLVSSLETWFPSLNLCLSAESHEWLFIYKSALSLLFTPCNICLCGRRRWRTRVLLPDKIMPKLAEFRGSCSQRSPLHRCVCFEDFQLKASLFLYLVSRHAALGLPTVKTWKSLIWGQISNAFALSLTRCQTRLQSCPGKSENKKPKEPFPLSFSIYALTSRSPPLAFPLSAS